MKKKYTAILFAVLLICFGSVCRAEQSLGYAKFSDIVTYINHYPIQSHNFQGRTLIAAEDLTHFGFDVKWNEYKRTLTISRNKAVTEVDIPYVTCPIKNQIGKNEFMVTSTDVKVFTESYEYAAYGGITGYTLIDINDLSCIDGVTVAWVPEVRAIKVWVDGLHQSEYMLRPIPNHNYYSVWDSSYYYNDRITVEPYVNCLDSFIVVSVALKDSNDDYYMPTGLYGYGSRMSLDIVDVIDANGDSILKQSITSNECSYVGYYYGITELPYAETVILTGSDLKQRQASENGGIIKYRVNVFGYSENYSVRTDSLPYGNNIKEKPSNLRSL